MTGRVGYSSSSGAVSGVLAGMSQKKLAYKEVSLESQATDEDTQEGRAPDDEGDEDEFSSSLLPQPPTRAKRRRERKNKPRAMTEEEMMDLALRLSEKEASVSALRLQQEEEAMMKAIQESMVGQTQPCTPSRSGSPSLEAEASHKVNARRKVRRTNGESAIVLDRATAEDFLCEDVLTGDEDQNRNKKRKRKDSFPPQEGPDLWLTQKIYPQAASACIVDSLPALPDSPQSRDSTQIQESVRTGCRVKVNIPRLSQDLMDTCRSSGFVLWSQDSDPARGCPPTRPRSPTFPGSPEIPSPRLKRSPPSETWDAAEAPSSPDYLRSPVFGRDGAHEGPGDRVGEHPGPAASAQESPGSSLGPVSCQPKSPVFPRSPGLPVSVAPSESSAFPTSPVFSDAAGGRDGPASGFCKEASDPRRRPVPTLLSPQLDRDEDAGEGKVTAAIASDDEDLKLREARLTSDMTLRWSDEDEDEVAPVDSPSPVFPGELNLQPDRRVGPVSGAGPGVTPDQCSLGCSASAGDPSRRATDDQAAATSAGEPAGGLTVHYYWGVPFCPRGLDADSYTKVILAQMEVYEKSLKRAQRGLLRKAEWGDAILPRPERSPSPESPPEPSEQQLPPRRGLGRRGEGETRDDEERREEEEEEEEEEEREDGAQPEADDCAVCPETQLSEDGAPDVPETEANVAAAAAPGRRAESPGPPDAGMCLQDQSPAAEEQQEEMEVDAAVDRETPGSGVPAVDEGHADVEEIRPRSASPEPEALAGPGVECPICQGSFHAADIEMHAAYCDGEVTLVDGKTPAANGSQASPWRKRTRRVSQDASRPCGGGGKSAGVSCPEPQPRPFSLRPARLPSPPPPGAAVQEKCYVCQKSVPLKDYSLHTELCIRRQLSRTAARGNLVSALEGTESRDSGAGPSGSNVQKRDVHAALPCATQEVIDLLDDDEDELEEGKDGNPPFKLSDSPIRSFTPISQAEGCLVDFKRQRRRKKPSQRRR